SLRGGLWDQGTALRAEGPSQDLLDDGSGQDRVLDQPRLDQVPAQETAQGVVDVLAMDQDPRPVAGECLVERGEEAIRLVRAGGVEDRHRVGGDAGLAI